MKLFSSALVLCSYRYYFFFLSPPYAPCFCLFVPFFKWDHLLSCTRNRLPVCRHVLGRYVHSAESFPFHHPSTPTQPPRPSFARPNVKSAGCVFFVWGEQTGWLKRCGLFREERRGNEASLWGASSSVRSAASTCCHLSSGHFNKGGVTSLVEKVLWPSGSARMRVIMVSIPVGDNGIPCRLICGFALEDLSWSSV